MCAWECVCLINLNLGNWSYNCLQILWTILQPFCLLPYSSCGSVMIPRPTAQLMHEWMIPWCTMHSVVVQYWIQNSCMKNGSEEEKANRYFFLFLLPASWIGLKLLIMWSFLFVTTSMSSSSVLLKVVCVWRGFGYPNLHCCWPFLVFKQYQGDQHVCFWHVAISSFRSFS